MGQRRGLTRACVYADLIGQYALQDLQKRMYMWGSFERSDSPLLAMSTTPEYESLKDCTPQLRLSVKDDLLTLGGELLAARLISDENEETLRDRYVSERERAAKLVSLVLSKVQETSQNYHTFVDILKRQLSGQQYAVIQRLQEMYDVHARSLEAEASNFSKQDEGKFNIILCTLYCPS